MKRNCDLDHPLKKLLVFGRCGAPNVFEGFVSVEEIGFVEQRDSMQILIRLHSSILAQRARKRSEATFLQWAVVPTRGLAAENHVVIAGGHEEE